MSVPTSERETSSIQYIETARKLAHEVLAYSTRVPKRYWQRLSNPLFNHATETYYHVQCANRIYAKSDSDYDNRRNHLLDALGNLDHVAALLDIAFDVQNNPNENAFGQLAGLIDRERKLIGGVMRHDRDSRE